MSVVMEAIERYGVRKRADLAPETTGLRVTDSPEQQAMSDQADALMLERLLGVDGHDVHRGAKRMADVIEGDIVRGLLDGQAQAIDLHAALEAAWIDGLGTGMELQRKEPSAIEVDGQPLVRRRWAAKWRRRALNAEARVRDLEVAAIGARTQLAQVLDGPGRTQLDDVAERAARADADDRLRAAQEAHDA